MSCREVRKYEQRGSREEKELQRREGMGARMSCRAEKE
jgi:hypothetical protein